MTEAEAQELLLLNQRLLDSIAAKDWPTYAQLSVPDLTAFEPEGAGQLIKGLAFHRFYFEPLTEPPVTQQSTMASPHVRLMGDVAVVAYVRLIQRRNPDGTLATLAFEETRVWQRHAGQWRHVHFHRSLPTASR
ncbi:MAG: DUF4440 domain-containing protein [Gemmataceae bacterium]|nr:DUF4440 domain-containing protein [Gemmataceae bacterium]MDW8264147.1 DUF4440 domain-containing protein [Gemmataceae bacterium]